jgi:GrpB-like predicted nucleotidyltransferase (UPF0157 family)/uncharacterized cupin superfamily protein
VVSQSWPAWATEPIEIVDPDPAWAARAAALREDLEDRLGPWLEGDIEHVGSTAVPGLAAKPVVDLLAPARLGSVADRLHRPLAEAGWELVPPELDGRAWRRLYVLAEGGRRLAHLHLVDPSNPRWCDEVTFRDQLRQRPDLATAYARLKRLAAVAHRDDREAYTDAKSDFVRRVLAEPGANPNANSPSPPRSAGMRVHHVLDLDLEPDALDPSQVVAGSPEVRSLVLHTSPDGRVERGVWEITPGVVTDVEADELFVVVTGRATIEVDEGPTLEVGPGDAVVLEEGWRTRWTIHETLRKVYQATS